MSKITKKYQLFFCSMILLLFLFQGCRHNSNEVRIVDFPLFVSNEFAEADSIKIDNLYIDVWNWAVKNEQIVILSKENRDNFLYVFSLPKFGPVYKCGNYGGGPDEFTAVNWINMLNNRQVGLYDIPRKKMYTYDLMSDTLVLNKTFEFRIWERNVAPPYTSIQQINDSLFVMKADMKEFTELELVNINTGEILQIFRPMLERESKIRTSAPYIFNVSANNNNIVLAYNFINRLELFKLDDGVSQIKPFLVIGSAKDQSDKKIEDYVVYYTDVYCNNKYIYALSQQGGMRESIKNSIIEIYTLDGVPVKKITLDKHLHYFTIDYKRGVIYGYDSYVDFNYVYVYKIDIL